MKTRIIWLAALTLLAAMMISGTAFAEGGEPPAAPDDTATVVAEAPPAPAEAPPPAEPEPAAPPTEPPAVEEPAVSIAVEEPIEAAPAAEEALPAVEELPLIVEEPVLVNAAGAPLVLASEESAELLENADPYFTVGLTKYCFVPLAGTCDVSCGVCIKDIKPIQTCINYLDTNLLVPTDGFVYVEKATYAESVIIDGTSTYLNSLSGLLGLPSLGLWPTISGTLTLQNLTNGFTLLGFNVTGGTLIKDSSGQFNIDTVSGTLTMSNVDASGKSDDGIYILRHKGNIVFHHVTASNNTGNGVFIDGQLSGSVTIDKFSEFNQNTGIGLKIITVGNVTLNNVIANENGNSGMRIETPGTVTLGSVQANRNGSYGIDIYYNPSGSLININGVIANDNTAAGIFVRSRGATIKNVITNGNDQIGLWVAIKGGTTLLENVVANENGNFVPDGTTDEFGVKIWSESGTAAVTLRNITANVNEDGGIFSTTLGAMTVINSSTNNNHNGDGLFIQTNGAVTLTNFGAFNNNKNGLYVRTKGAITITGIWAGNNGFSGADLDNCLYNDVTSLCAGTGTVRLTTVYANDNQGGSILIYSKGLITLSGVEANNNWRGIFLQNDFSGAIAGITLATVRADSNGNTGITAWTNGALIMSNINAQSNAMTWGGMDAGSTVQNYYNSGKGPDHWWFEAVEGELITLRLWADGWNGSEWLNRFDFDPLLRILDENGNEITSNQTIDSQYNGVAWNTDYYEIVWTPDTGEGGWYYLEASSDNNSSGFYRLSINDDDPSNFTNEFWVGGLSYRAGGNVSLSGLNNFNDNEQAGLIGWNGGNVTLANFVAFGNGCEGIYVDNTDGSGNVTLTGVNASAWNGWEGLRIISDGAVSISNLEAFYNGQDGIRIAANTPLKTVTLTNIAAMWNGISGIEMQTDGGTHGLTTLNNVRAWFNNEDGVNVDTNGYNLTVLNSSFMCNNDDGFVYWWYPPLFVFTNINNIFLGNGGDDL